MCYDLSFSSSIESIYEILPELMEGGQLDLNLEPTYHKLAQAYPKWPVVINDGGQLKLKRFEWGVIPGYLKTAEDIKKGRKWMVNARSEKLLDKKAYWNRIRVNRCLIPATGFFEYREVPGWKNKVPYYIRVKTRPIFFVAGLYAYPTHVPNVETGEITGTFSLITRPANEVMKRIHNGGENAGRMPLILSPDLEKEWLNPNNTDIDIQRIIDYEIPSDWLDYWTVESVRKVKADDESVIAYKEYEGLPAL